MSTKKGLLVPAIRARTGDWWFYVATLTFAEVAARVKPVSEIHEKAELKTWIQRDIKKERLGEISTYLLTNPQRFFNSIVLGIYGGEPDWLPVNVSKNLANPEVELDESVETAFGLIQLSGEEEIFAIDGQHRVEGIKHALGIDHENLLKKDQQTVIFVSHKTTDEGRERTRRLFTTLNKYAKPVSQGDIIALSEDDTFAIVTRQLIDFYPGLRRGFISLLPNLSGSDKKSLTSLITLYEVVKIISLPTRNRQRKKLEIGPPDSQKVESFFQTSVQFWDACRKHFPEVEEVCASEPDAEVSAKYRNNSGGHLLLRPFGLVGIAKAVRFLMDRGLTIDQSVELIAKAPLELSGNPWRHVIWNPTKSVVVNKNSRLIKNFLLVCVGQEPEPKTFDVQEAYRKAVGDIETDYLPPKL